MKRLCMVLAGVGMALSGGAAVASSMSLTHFKPKVMPVLVAVNAKGHVTKVLPSTPLSPKLQRLLAENLDEWIAKPAMAKGHAVGSQVIVSVALRAEPRKDGNYDVNFAYVSMLPSPYGSAAHWVWKDGDQLALVSDSDAGLRQRMWRPRPVPPPRMNWRPRMDETMRPASNPPAPRPVPPPRR
ncbi:hypothetical protein [Rhodanobacter glycinis]|uniref:hypothetical protein n=1 Tax=Rhodanobacter glycinis TaxID=582702 RepID=UPI001114206C|nr:hypothetical protein [Rhodanobacter glycinis]